MRFLPATAALLCAAASLSAQQSILFTGRFPFVSLDSVNERPGGSASRIDEFDFAFVTPGPGAFARSLQPATAHQAYLGDGDNNGNYTKFNGFKTYFENVQMGGLFVKAADKASVTPHKVFFTVRDNVTTAGKDIEVFTTNGTAVHVMRPGDWVRFTSNGNVEFFVTADQLDTAAGPPAAGGTSIKGAHALLQTPGGDLYYVPVQGGHWVNGNFGGIPLFAQDGAICKIDAAAITYDGSGNVQSIAANSARLVIDEVAGGTSPAPITIRQMVLNSGAQNRDGIPAVVAATFGKLCGIDFDPNGGTFQSTFQDPAGNYTNEPNLVWCSDAGSYAGTIWSTASNGTVATINGVLCGSLTPGAPATGSWLGVNFDYANFQPSLMSLVLTNAVAYEPLVLDMPAFGALPPAATQPTWDIDAHGANGMVMFLVAQIGPLAPGGFPTSVPTAVLPPLFTADSYGQAFVAAAPISLGLGIANPSGYTAWSFANPHFGVFTGMTLLLQAAGLVGSSSFQLSNPVLMQLK
jgi:hypothetical protein